MTNSRKIVLTAFVVVSIALSGCVGVVALFYFSSLTKTFATHGVWLMGEYRFGRASYDVLEFGHEDRWYDGTPEIEIRLTRGNTQILLSVHDLDIAPLRQSGVVREMTRGPFSGAEHIQLECNHFYIVEDSLARLSVQSSRCRTWIIELRSDQSEPWRAMPLSDSDAIELFGEPAHTRVFFKP